MISRSILPLRPLFKNLLINQKYFTCRQIKLVRLLSYSAFRFSVTQKELSLALQEEIDAETKLESENLGGSSSPSIPGFKISTKGAEVRLRKSHNNEEILVIFNVNHSVDVEDEYSDNPDTAPVPVALPPFTIEITKNDRRLCFHLDLVETEDQQYDFRVEEFYVAPASKGEDESVDENVYASSGKYIDPTLHELLFLRYLEERGFTQDFCRNLVNFATHYEHSQYVKLLINIKSFISN